MFKYYLIVFLISMVPLIELRGAIPVGFAMIQAALNLEEGAILPPFYIVTIYLTAIVGNMLPVPVIFFFARKFLEWGKDKRFIGKICTFFLVKGKNAGEKLTGKAGRGGVFIALLLFVGIPLPGTGAWTGTLAASLLDMKAKDTALAVMLGVLLAGLIMMAGSFGLFTALFSVIR